MGHVGVGLGRVLGVVGGLGEAEVVHGGLGGAGGVFGPFSPVFAVFCVVFKVRDLQAGRPDVGEVGKVVSQPLGLVQGLNTAQNQSLFHQSLFAKKTITNFQSWVIPRENKKDRLAQLWNSFENVNIGELFSKLGNTFSSLD